MEISHDLRRSQNTSRLPFSSDNSFLNLSSAVGWPTTWNHAKSSKFKYEERDLANFQSELTKSDEDRRLHRPKSHSNVNVCFLLFVVARASTVRRREFHC